MKKGLLIFASALFFWSCNEGGEASIDSDAPHSTHASNTEKHRMILRAIESGDMSSVDTLISDDFVDHEGNMGRDIVGRDSTMAYLSKIHNYFDNLKMEMQYDATSADGNYYFALVRMTGTAKENPWGMPAGQQIDDMSVDVVKFNDQGKATDHWSFISMKDMLEMMGAMPAGNTASMPAGATDTAR